MDWDNELTIAYIKKSPTVTHCSTLSTKGATLPVYSLIDNRINKSTVNKITIVHWMIFIRMQGYFWRLYANR